ncbi:MAG TPA: hypothetical protein VGX72_03560 [Solirubrobacteraceae bacterium]|jgi:hypothetical protein|nr:hypothetical protein [Solirubrobacteraceae bacterium]
MDSRTVETIARAQGATLNDVLLAAVSDSRRDEWRQAEDQPGERPPHQLARGSVFYEPSTAAAISTRLTSSAVAIWRTVVHAGLACPSSIRASEPVVIPERNASAS